MTSATITTTLLHHIAPRRLRVTAYMPLLLVFLFKSWRISHVSRHGEKKARELKGILNCCSPPHKFTFFPSWKNERKQQANASSVIWLLERDRELSVSPMTWKVNSCCLFRISNRKLLYSEPHSPRVIKLLHASYLLSVCLPLSNQAWQTHQPWQRFCRVKSHNRVACCSCNFASPNPASQRWYTPRAIL